MLYDWTADALRKLEASENHSQPSKMVISFRKDHPPFPTSNASHRGKKPIRRPGLSQARYPTWLLLGICSEQDDVREGAAAYNPLAHLLFQQCFDMYLGGKLHWSLSEVHTELYQRSQDMERWWRSF